MKSCDEMAKNIIRRVEDYEVKKQHKQKMIFRTALSLTSLCIVALIGFGVWNFRNKGINNDYINENNNYVSEENNYVSEKSDYVSEENDYDNEESFNGYEVIKMNSDRIVYNSFDELLEDAELVIIGEVAENPEQNLEYSYSRYFKKDILTDATTYAKVKVLKVLEGEIDKDEVVVKQRCGILEDEKQLVTFSEMTPLVSGDKWIFFLYADGDESDVNNIDEDYLEATYWCVGDYNGRYPVPDESILAEKDTATIYNEIKNLNFGIWEGDIIPQYNIYNEILSKYDLTLSEKS